VLTQVVPQHRRNFAGTPVCQCITVGLTDSVTSDYEMTPGINFSPETATFNYNFAVLRLPSNEAI